MRMNAKTGNFELTQKEINQIAAYGRLALASARRACALPLDKYKAGTTVDHADMVQIAILDLLKEVGIEFPEASRHNEIDLRDVE